MRVCMMNDNFNRSSGAAIAIRRISEVLTDIEYCYACCKSGGSPEDLSWIPNDRFQRFDLKSSNPLSVLSELLRLRKWLKLQRCDLVHCHHRRLSVLLELARIPVLYTGHLVFDPSAWFRWLHPCRMTAVTPSVAKNILETTGRRVLACIGNPVVFPNQPPDIDLKETAHRAVCVARLDAVKGHRHLLSAWKLLCDRGHRYELYLVGEGSLRSEMQAQVRRDGLEDLIRFCGFSSDVLSVISKALYAILVSELEGQGIVTLEAAAMGRPSLLTAVPGSVDLLPPQRHLKNGLEFGNVTELANTLEDWFSRADEVKEEGKIFYDFLKPMSDPRQIARRYREVYHQIVSEMRGLE